MNTIEDYRKLIFQLNEFIRHLLIDGNDVKSKQIGYWIDYWDRIEKENQDIINDIYKIKDGKYKNE